jgi:predicted transcriptional regulator of viral defense system
MASLNFNANAAIGMASQAPLLRAKQLRGQGLTSTALSRLVARGQLVRVAHGLYSPAGMAESAQSGLAIVAARVPQAVLCLLSALQFHGLTSALARQVWIAMPRGSHAPQLGYPPLKMVQCAPQVHAAGVELHDNAGVSIRVYSVAKTVADCFKHRHKVGLDVAIAALKEARASKRASTDALWQFAKINRVSAVMRPYMEAIE